jgi:hypothetical protein
MSEPGPIEVIRRIEIIGRIVDAIIPGDGSFPAASAVGVQEKLLERGHTSVGAGYADRLIAALGIVGSQGADAIEAALAAYEARDPDAFETLLTIVYMSYYESPEVKAAIRAMGFVYNDTPQPAGYAMSAFDPANPLESPRHGRGHYVPTAEVERVAWERLGDLGKRVG